jgi:hypothetical protein
MLMGAWSPWGDANYAWVVICQNKKFHRQTNLLYGHKIPLGETDAVSPAPVLGSAFLARCDECGEERSYEPDEVLRVEMNLPDAFTPHPLFSTT